MNRKIIIVTGSVIVAATMAVLFILNPQEASLIEQIEQSQENYFAQHGRYWQGLPDFLTPVDDPDGWKDIPKNAPYKVWVDVYENREGRGYQITTVEEKDRTIITKSVGYGPEAEHRTYQTTEVIPPEPPWVASTTP